MKNIKKIGKAVAGSALLVGATLAGAASFAAAQSGSSGDHTLGDYPAPYVGEDGNVDASIVVGQSAKTVDVVGAVDIAGSLSQAAFTEESVSAGGGTFGWSATNGVTLDTRNDQLYFTNSLDEVRDTLTEDQLDALSETTFRDDDGDSTDIEYFLYAGNQTIQYGQPDDRSNDDPVLYVENPSSLDTTDNHLFRLQANMEEEIAFNSTAVEDEEIDLFGKEYTVSTETTDSELVLFGSQEEHDIASGESETLTINGNEHTIEVVAVTSSTTVAFRVDGSLREEEEDDKFTIDGQEVRIADVIQTNSQESEGLATFAIGTEELHLRNGEAIEDSEGDDIDGTLVEFNDGTNNNAVDEVSTINVWIGSNDDDQEYVTPAEDGSYSHPQFENFEFHFAGLNPDGSEEGDNVGQVSFSTTGDDTATVSLTETGDESATVEYAHTPDPEATSPVVNLADDDNDAIHVVEGSNATEDEYFSTDAGDFPHLWEVTSIDVDSETSLSQGDEATAQLRDVVSGANVEVDLDAGSDGDNDYEGTEVIDGQTYTFLVGTQGTSSSSDNIVTTTWGDGSGELDPGQRTTVYAPSDTQSGAAVALTKDTGETISASAVVELPSTESTDAKTQDLSTLSGLSGTGNTTFTVGQTLYVANNETVNNLVSIAVDSDQGGVGTIANPGVLTVEPEDDNDRENAYLEVPSVDTGDDEMTVNSPVYTGTNRQTASLESNDDVTAGYDIFGTFSWYDSDSQGELTLNVPFGQATAGAAFTGQDGSLSGSGSAGSVTTQTPAGWPDVGALDSDSNIGQLKQNRNLILVGGPVVNSLVQELANADKTWKASQYSQGQAIVQQIDDAFSQGNDALVVAGKSGSDTREAANFLADYEANQDRLAGKDQVTLTTAQSTS